MYSKFEEQRDKDVLGSSVYGGLIGAPIGALLAGGTSYALNKDLKKSLKHALVGAAGGGLLGATGAGYLMYDKYESDILPSIKTADYLNEISLNVGGPIFNRDFPLGPKDEKFLPMVKKNPFIRNFSGLRDIADKANSVYQKDPDVSYQKAGSSEGYTAPSINDSPEKSSPDPQYKVDDNGIRYVNVTHGAKSVYGDQYETVAKNAIAARVGQGSSNPSPEGSIGAQLVTPVSIHKGWRGRLKDNGINPNQEYVGDEWVPVVESESNIAFRWPGGRTIMDATRESKMGSSSDHPELNKFNGFKLTGPNWDKKKMNQEIMNIFMQ